MKGSLLVALVAAVVLVAALAVTASPLVALAVALGLPGLIWAIRYPEVLVALTVTLQSTTGIVVADGVLTIYKAALVASLGVALALAVAQRRLHLPPAAWLVPFLGLEIWGMIAALARGSVWVYDFRIAGNLLMAWLVAQTFRRPEHVRRVGPVFIGATWVHALGMAWQLPASWWTSVSPIRAAGLLGNANGSARTAVALGFIGLGAWALGRTTVPRTAIIVTAIPIVATLIMSVSRGTTAATLLSLLVLALVGPKRLERKVAAAVTLALAALLVWTAAPKSFLNRFDRTIQVDRGSGQAAVDDSGRSALNAIAVRAIAEAPLFGIGPEVFARRAIVAFGSPQPSHNMFLNASSERGLPAGMFWLWLVLVPLVVSLMQLRRCPPPWRPWWLAMMAASILALITAQSGVLLVSAHDVFVGCVVVLLARASRTVQDDAVAPAATPPQVASGWSTTRLANRAGGPSSAGLR